MSDSFHVYGWFAVCSLRFGVVWGLRFANFGYITTNKPQTANLKPQTVNQHFFHDLSGIGPSVRLR